MKKWLLISGLLLPLQLLALSNFKINGKTEETVTSLPYILQITGVLSRPGAVLEGGIYADYNENGQFDEVDYSWNWRWGYVTDGIGWIVDPAQSFASVMGDEGAADGLLKITFPLIGKQAMLWPRGLVFIFMKDEDGTFGLLKLHLNIEAQAPGIAGKLTDAASGAPVAGLRLSVGRQLGPTEFEFSSTISDSLGNYVFPLTPGTWDVYVDGAGHGTGAYKTTQALGVVVANNQLVTRNFALQKHPYLVTGKVLTEDGKPVSMLTLFCSIGFLMTETDQNGEYVLGVDNSPCDLSVSHFYLSNYMHLSQYYEEPSIQFPKPPLNGSATADITMKKYNAFIKGRCTFAGQPIMRAEIDAVYTDPVSGKNFNGKSISDWNGYYMVGVKPATIQQLTAYSVGHTPVDPPVAHTNFVVAAGDTVVKDFVFEIEQGPNSISGVITGPAGLPAQGIYVMAVEEQPIFYNTYFYQYSNAEGKFNFSGLKNGKWRVGIYKAGAIAAPAMKYYTLNSGTKITDANFTMSGYTGVDANTDAALPLSFELENNFPNPFNAATEIRFSIPPHLSGQVVTLRIHDALGRQVRSMQIKSSAPGAYRFQWNGSDDRGQSLSSGVYFYSLQAGLDIRHGKMALIR